MSYDYNALVQEFWKALEEATNDKPNSWMNPVQAAEILSQHCPMTPLLWMQYAWAARRLSPELELQILKLGLLEFPGSAVLHLRSVTVAQEERPEVLEQAIACVGKGSHRNQDGYIAQIYQKWLEEAPQEPGKVFVARSRVSMKSCNETIQEEAQTYLKENGFGDTCESVLAEIEEGSRWEARVIGSLAQYEDAVDAAMAKQGVLDAFASQQSVDWDAVLQNKSVNMGLGGFELARAFIQYAKEAQRLKTQDATVFSTHQFAFLIYERGVAECPTVESLWLNYIIDLTRSPEGLDRLASVTVRAVRNCPYSISLAQQRLYAMEKLAIHQKVVIDPEELLQVAKGCLDLQFLPPGASLELVLSALKVVKRRILWLLAQSIETKAKAKPLAYDDAEPLPRKEDTTQTTTWADDSNEELRDLVADLQDAYTEAESQLSSSSAIAELRKDRALTESFIILPLSSDPFEPIAASAVLDSFHASVKVHNPPHPKIYLTYIQQYAMRCSVRHPKDVLTRIRRVRFLFRSAIEKSGIVDDCNQGGEYKEALRTLGSAWIEWENVFGSERSIHRANLAIERKLEKLSEMMENARWIANESAKAAQQRRPVLLTGGESPWKPTKKPRTTEAASSHATLAEKGPDLVDDNARSVEVTHKSPIQADTQSEKPEKSVHPFTVRVSNLSFDTKDMDLVDAFRSKCGAIVHARVVRHKDNGKSKGWGLVQFESSTSTEKALALNDVLGLDERLLKIEPSQSPAVSLVPPGQHRINPKGTGKSSKRNDKRRSQKPPPSEQESKESQTGKQSSLLSFQPRSVARQQRAKIQLK